MPRFRNVNAAFVGMLERVLDDGIETDSRNGRTIELTAQTIVVERPLERLVYAPGRNNNPFAAIAETMWVLAGRSDLAYLTPYLRRAPEFSDDGGVTWRAGYGPRLRDWHGVDQLSAVREMLHNSPSSRRAAISLLDPAEDFQDSKDIPCNNWLHFLAREGQLDLNVAARSTDIWWGFSGINAFEWTVALQLMARWLDLEPGILTFFTSSLHLYERHRAQAQVVLSQPVAEEPYIGMSVAKYDTDWRDADSAMRQWMDLEALLRRGASLDDLVVEFHDPLLIAFIRAIDVFWMFKRGAPLEALEPKLATLGDTDLAFAAREFLGRPNAAAH